MYMSNTTQRKNHSMIPASSTYKIKQRYSGIYEIVDSSKEIYYATKCKLHTTNKPTRVIDDVIIFFNLKYWYIADEIPDTYKYLNPDAPIKPKQIKALRVKNRYAHDAMFEWDPE